MNPTHPSNAKWIALSVLILFILSGGAYKLLKKNGEPQNQGAVTSPESKPHSNTGRSSDASTAASGAPEAKGTGASTSVAAHAPIPGAAQTPAPASATAPAMPQDTCFTIAYKHKPVASHTDEETCSHHKNLVRIPHKNANAKSVCIRVNGAPVHYLSVKGKADEFIFGSIAGPKSKVTVSYCTGKLTSCASAAQDCIVPKDEFMEAIGGSQGEKGDARLGQWDPTNPPEREADVMAKLDGEVKRELETNDELNGRSPAGEIFKDWIPENEKQACGTQHAKN